MSKETGREYKRRGRGNMDEIDRKILKLLQDNCEDHSLKNDCREYVFVLPGGVGED